MQRDAESLPPGGHEDARALLEGVYDELRRLAHAEFARGLGAPTLQTTALVHEAWLRLEREGRPEWANRAQFFVAAATAMRRILIDRARARSKGASTRIDWSLAAELAAAGEENEQDARALLDLDVALDDLRDFSEDLARLVELRAFAGLGEAEVAQTLQRSERSVRRDWRGARLWLFRRIRELRGDTSAGKDHGDAP